MAEKLYAGCVRFTAKNFVLVDKIEKKISCKIYNLPIFSLSCIKTGWGCPQIWYHLLAHLSQMKDLLFVCRYVESIRFKVMNFRLTAVRQNLSQFCSFSPAKIFWGSKINISKHRSSARPPRELCVKITWRSVDGRKFTAWVPIKNKKVHLQNISRYA